MESLNKLIVIDIQKDRGAQLPFGPISNVAQLPFGPTSNVVS